ncbi:MAG TPA: YggT family protein [Jiangellales bacterium]|nr:YggT family protein [Jiangellales bacterium]
MAVVGQVLDLVLLLFFIALLARLVFDWVFLFARSWEPKGPVLLVLEAVYSVTDPPLKAIRKVIPPLKIGTIALDLAFIVLIIAVQIARAVVRSAL